MYETCDDCGRTFAAGSVCPCKRPLKIVTLTVQFYVEEDVTEDELIGMVDGLPGIWSTETAKWHDTVCFKV